MDKKEREIAELKAQVNALRGVVIDICASPNPVSVGEGKRAIKKTPAQCLAEYNEKVINDLFGKYGHYSIDTFEGRFVNEYAAEIFLKDLKND